MSADDADGDDDVMNGLPADADAGRLRPRKSADAFRTISEVADELHVPQHVLRFWETKFPQVRPLKRGGGRRYYRPEDVLLLRRVADLLYTQGYTIKGVQRLLRDGNGLLQDNIPPASADERLAAQMERTGLPVEALPKRVTPPLLPIPGLDPGSASPAAPRGAPPVRPAPNLEADRLRALLNETLHALEEMRRLLA